MLNVGGLETTEKQLNSVPGNHSSRRTPSKCSPQIRSINAYYVLAKWWGIQAKRKKLNIHSMRLFCRGVPVSTMRLLVLMPFSALEIALPSLRRMWPSSQITKSGPSKNAQIIQQLIQNECPSPDREPIQPLRGVQNPATLWFSYVNKV